MYPTLLATYRRQDSGIPPTKVLPGQADHQLLRIRPPSLLCGPARLSRAKTIYIMPFTRVEDRPEV